MHFQLKALVIHCHKPTGVLTVHSTILSERPNSKQGDPNPLLERE